MEYVIQCTLQTLTGLIVIGVWLLVGYAIKRFYWRLAGKELRFTWKTIVGIISPSDGSGPGKIL